MCFVTSQSKMPLDPFSITADEGGRKHCRWAVVGVGRTLEVSNRPPAPCRNGSARLRWGRKQVSENRALGWPLTQGHRKCWWEGAERDPGERLGYEPEAEERPLSSRTPPGATFAGGGYWPPPRPARHSWVVSQHQALIHPFLKLSL